MQVTYADRTNQKVQLEHLNMQDEEHGFVVDNLAGQLYRYDPEEDEDDAPAAADAKKKAAKGKKKGLDVEGWGHFLEDYLAGDATPYTRSQRAPKNNAALPVKIATGQNFDELVNQPDKDVMIEFYGHHSPHNRMMDMQAAEATAATQWRGHRQRLSVRAAHCHCSVCPSVLPSFVPSLCQLLGAATATRSLQNTISWARSCSRRTRTW